MNLQQQPETKTNESSPITPEGEGLMVMQKLQTAKESGDIVETERLQALVDYQFLVSHDAHVQKRDDFNAGVAIARGTEAQKEKDLDILKTFNTDPQYRMNKQVDALVDAASSEAASFDTLITSISFADSKETRQKRLEALADKSATYLASNTLRDLAQESSASNPDSYNQEYAKEVKKYLAILKDKFKEINADVRVIDILASGADRETKIAKLGEIIS